MPEAGGSKKLLWAGWIISALPALMMCVGGIYGLSHADAVREQMGKFGYPDRVALPLTIIEIVCAVIYMIPRTSTLGAILLTGYLGGATATHVRVSEPVFVVPVIVGIVVWVGLLLREPRLWPLLPLRR
ncbi:MAG TPA: DoxX family protein [Tepidisphaeraceae bacterium]|jgi:hypothetical protein